MKLQIPLISILILLGMEQLCAQEEIIPYRKYKKWYYVHSSQGRIGSNIYQDAFSFFDEVAVVRNNNKYGFVNRNDSLIVPCIYDYAKCYLGDLQVSIAGDTFSIDMEGNRLEELGNYYYDSPFFKSTLNRVFLDNGKFGVTFLGDTTISALYDSLVVMDFTDAIFIWDEHDKIGIFNSQGKQIIPFELDSFKLDHDFNPHLIFIYRKGRIGAINLIGEVMAYPKYDNLEYENRLVFTVLKNGSRGYIYKGEEYWKNFLWW